MEPQEAYQRFLPLANGIEPDAVVPLRGDASLAFQNAKRGLEAVLEWQATVERDLPQVKLDELREIPDLAQAVIFAATRATREGRSRGTINFLLARAHPFRRKLLAAAVAFSEAGVLPSEVVDQILQGRGPADAANDCVDLVALFRKHEATLRGKSPITAADLEEAARLGSELQAQLSADAEKGSDELNSNVDARNRLWSLLVQRHRDLWRVGAWIWAQEVDEHVPPLQSRKKGGRGARSADGETSSSD
jgi:hypothetical protein